MGMQLDSEVGHRQPVRAFIAKPDPSKSAQQVDIWMEHLDGPEPREHQQRTAENSYGKDIRVFDFLLPQPVRTTCL